VFDRHGPDAGIYLRVAAYAASAGALTGSTLLVKLGFHWWILPVALIVGAGSAALALALMQSIGRVGNALFVSGASTPYEEQYSYERSLVMNGRVGDAVASLEKVIAEDPTAVRARIEAAELYTRELQNHTRAAELFRDARRAPALSTGNDVYLTNRLVDLLLGPLADPGRALVELRALVERHPDSRAVAHARDTIRDVKARLYPPAP
jgi:hypothetical protein